MRFNDSLILGIDIDSAFTPNIGNPNTTNFFSYNQAKKIFGENLNYEDLSRKTNCLQRNESYKTAQFIGLISRIHNFINQCEYEINMPGCRTIISSGLRYRFKGRKNKKSRKDTLDNYFSANFSFSNAYKANELGSSCGFVGNRCFIEKNVIQLCGYDNFVKRAIGFSKFIRAEKELDPFDGRNNNFVQLQKFHFTLAQKININLFRKEYTFREINTLTASNFQLFPKILVFFDKKNYDEVSLIKHFENSLKNDTPSLEELLDKGTDIHFHFPIMFMSISLQESIVDLYVEMTKNN